jgi:L-galactonate 5-dehydrogenase
MDHGQRMQALLIEEAGRARLHTTSVPAPAVDEVLLRVRTVGFCGSDLNTFRGQNPLVSYPRVPGHEIAATVERVGPDVPEGRFPEGARVTVLPYTACGRCAACRRDRANACEDNQTLGVQRDGALTELIAVPWQKVVPGGGLSLRDLALVEPLAVGFHAVERARVESRDVTAVVGCGAVGLGAVAGAARRGSEVIAIDVDERKLDLARAAGAKHSVNSRAQSLHASLRELTLGRGPDVMVEAVGLPETFVAAVDEVAFAGKVVYIGYAKQPVAYDTAKFVKKELDILGSRNATPTDFEAVIRMLRDGQFPAEGAVTRVVPLLDAGRALEAWSADPGGVTRVHVELV